MSENRPRPTHTVIVPSTAHAYQVIGVLLEHRATFTAEPGTNGVWHLGVLPGGVQLLSDAYGPMRNIDIRADPDQLSTYTIYENPVDIAGARFAVRRFTTMAGQSRAGELLGTAESLEEARRLIPDRADTCFARQDEDDAAIVETWM
jgi:hypothetical protein